MKYIHIFTFFTVAFCSLVFTASAQRDLTVEDAIKLGLANNYDIRVEKLNIEVNQLNNVWGEAGRLPEVFIDGTWNNAYTYNRPANPFAIPGVNINSAPLGTLMAQIVLFQGGRVRFNKRMLEQLEVQSEADAAIVIENTIQGIILAYYMVLLQQENLSVLEKVMSLSRDRLEYVKLQKELGSAGNFEVSQEETNFYQDSTNYVNQELVYRNAVRDLNFLMSIDDLEEHYNFVDNLDIDPADLKYEELLLKVKQQNNQIKRQRVLQDIALNEVDIQRTNYSPTISLGTGLTAGRTYLYAPFPDFDTDVFPRPINEEWRAGYSYGPFVNLTLSVPIYTAGRNNRAVQTAKINQEIVKVQADNLELSVVNDLNRTFDAYKVNRQAWHLAQKTKDAANLNLELSEERFKTGNINSFDYRLVQINYLNAAYAELQAVYELINAYVQLLRITGGIIDIAE